MPRSRKRDLLASLDRRATPILLVTPFFVLFAVFGLFPLLYTFWVSLHDWQLINGDQGFVGLRNFSELFGDSHFYNALSNTVTLFLLSTVPQIALALGIAALLDRPLRARAFWRSVVLLPNVVSVAAIALIFAQLFGRDFGVVNWLLGLFGMSPLDWQAQGWSAQPAIALIVIWRWAGYNSLLYLAAMQSVPTELYEAAELDGASRWRQFFSITVPGIRPTIVFTTVVSAIGGMQIFVEPQLFDSSGVAGTGGDDRQFQTLIMYLYEKGFTQFDAGYAAAIAWVVFLASVVLALAGVVLARRIAGSG
ncbi:carbohydrate ABC transporter permease [Amycolatopsis speibonae]|uniref:Carbohydrate ABC transporter permease n=1 Tax=Amycolatopsis speibonae TaxID=1450224 RepID=A0ABV7P3X0_9PSEU